MKTREQLRLKATDRLRTGIDMIKQAKPHNQRDYDEWHEKTCYDIRGIYISAHVSLTFGQVQKWVNMTLKYLYSLGARAFDGYLDYLHVPLDDHTFVIAKRNLRIPRPKEAWSRWDDYSNDYMKYQRELRARISGCSPFQWEMVSWNPEHEK